MIDIEKSKKELINYVDMIEIDTSEIERKIYHTFRVMNNCKKIANMLRLPNEQINLAQLIGLLHDIGRFEQYKIYNKSVGIESSNKDIKFDHGKVGVEILKKDNYIRKYIEDDQYDKIIFTAICEHNKYEISKGLSKEEELFCKIIKDADKLDIFYESVYIFWQKKNQIKEIESGKLSSKMLQDFYNYKLSNKQNEVNKIDEILKIASFIYDINFKCSFEILKENNNINKMIDRFDYKLPQTKQDMEKIKEIVNKYVIEKTK